MENDEPLSSTSLYSEQDQLHCIDFIQQKLNHLTNELHQLKLEASNNQHLRDIRKLVAKFPLCNLKQTQYLHAVQQQLVTLKIELDNEKRNSKALSQKIDCLLSLHNNSNAISDIEHCSTHSIAGSSHHSINTDTLKNCYVPSNLSTPTDHCVMSDGLKQLLTQLQEQILELKRAKTDQQPIQKLIEHLNENLMGIEMRLGDKIIWKVSGFMTIYENCVIEQKRNRLYTDSNRATSFQCPRFITVDGYCMYMRLYPYGCDDALGKCASLFVAVCAGRYDAILEWPFRKQIHVSVIDQIDNKNNWAQTIIPSRKYMNCFHRPSSIQGNPGVGILHFLNHSDLFGRYGSSGYLRNNVMFIEVKFSEP